MDSLRIQFPFLFLINVISHNNRRKILRLLNLNSNLHKVLHFRAKASFASNFKVHIWKSTLNKEKHPFSLLNILCFWWTLISTLLSLIYWCRVVLHSSGIGIMLVKSRECFVDLSLTPTQFLASNFLITGEYEFSAEKTQLETRMCNYSRMKVSGSSIT